MAEERLICDDFMAPNDKKRYLESCKEQARSVLHQFATLNRILDGFSNLDNLGTLDIRNVIFWKCVWAYRGSTADYAKLKALDEVLKTVNVVTLAKADRKDFLSRLASDDFLKLVSDDGVRGLSPFIEQTGKRQRRFSSYSRQEGT